MTINTAHCLRIAVTSDMEGSGGGKFDRGGEKAASVTVVSAAYAKDRIVRPRGLMKFLARRILDVITLGRPVLDQKQKKNRIVKEEGEEDV